MTARVSMLLKLRASRDMLPFSLCNKKRLAILHMNRSLFSTTLSIPSYDNRMQVGLRTYQQPLVCVRFGQNQITSCVPQPKGILQRFGLSLCLFNVFINDIIECTYIEGTHSPVINGLRIPGPSFADDLPIASFTSYELQKKIVKVFIQNNLNKSKIMVFKKEGKLKAT